MNTLKSQLSEYQAGFKQRAAPERVAMMEAANAQLRASGIEDTALPLGTPVPNVSLTDALGNTVCLKGMHVGKTTVIIFYWGGGAPTAIWSCVNGSVCYRSFNPLGDN